MALIRGTRLGPYQIESPIGAGGMGEVYKATDTRLERTVAIKVLPAHVASDPERKQRFEREAKTVAALSHPHICPVFDVGSEDGTDFLVMEYLKGETLAERLTKGALPLDQALKYAIEVADALDKAHRQGVTHRDLKPANIMLTKAGAKLLDFGLAKLKPTGPQSDASTKLADALTEQGTILGTFQYMAPEQLEGHEADARTDIWAFGCVVYEMVTGQKAFDGKTQASLIGAILHKEPTALSSVEPLSPPGLDYVAQTCLAKDPDDRWQAAGDLLRELKRVQAGDAISPGSALAVPQPALWQRAVPATVVALLLMALSGLTVWVTTRPTPPQLTRTLIATPPDAPLETSGAGVDVAISSDGARIVYTAVDSELNSQLMVRSLNQFEATLLQESGSPRGPFFSPDGNWVGFLDRTVGTLMKTSAMGGPPVTICKVQGAVLGASWGLDDTIIFNDNVGARGLWRVSAAGGEPEVLSAPDTENGEYSHRWPEILPGGEAVLFNIFMAPNDPETAQIAVLSLDTGEYHVVVPSGGSNPRYVSTGHLIYAVNDSLRAIGFDLDRLETIGTPVPVLEHLMVKRQGAANFGVSLNGSLVYNTAHVPPELSSTQV